MLILNTNVIILKKNQWKESSYIFQALSQSEGLISIIAQGVKKNKGQSENFQLYNELDLELSKSDSSSFFKVKSINDILNSALSLTYEHFLMMEACTELLFNISVPYEDYDELYKLVNNYIYYLKNIKKNYSLYILKFYNSILQLIGHPLCNLFCDYCHKQKDNYTICYENHHLICNECSSQNQLKTISINPLLLHMCKNIDNFWTIINDNRFVIVLQSEITMLLQVLLKRSLQNNYEFKTINQFDNIK